MAEANMQVEIKLESTERKAILQLREQQRTIKKEIKRLQDVDKNSDRIEEWKMLHTLKTEIVGRLQKQGISWKRFIATPDYFEFAWYVSSGTPGAPRRIKTSMSKPPATETRTDEATMIKNAAEQRSKIVSRKVRKKSSVGITKTASGKIEVISKSNIS